MDSFFNDIASVCDNDSLREGAKTLGDFGRGLVYGAIESPVNGVAQIANTAIEPLTGHSLKLNLTGISDDLVSGDCNATAVEIGATVGGIIPFYAANKVAGKAFGRSMSAAKTAEGLGLQTARYSVGGSLAQGALTGGVMGAVFTPTAEGENLLWDRAENGSLGIAGGALFQWANDASRLSLSKFGQFGRGTTSEFMLKELPLTVGTGALAGAGTGLVNAHLTALMKEQRLAKGEEMQHGMIMDGIMGGGFGAAHQIHSRFVKAAPATEAQKTQLQLVKVDESDPTWAPMFKRSIPAAELESVESIIETMRRPRGHLAYQDVPVVPRTGYGPVSPSARDGMQWSRYAKNEPLVSGDVYVLRSQGNNRTMGAAFIENYKKQEWYKNSVPFHLLAYVGVEPQFRSTGIGKHFLADELISTLKKDNPHHAGLAVEVEDYKGLPASSQQQTRARFYRDKLGMEELNMPHLLPPFAPEEAAGVRLRSLKDFCERNSLPIPEEPIPARLLWKSFNDESINHHVGGSMQSRIYHSGYGVDFNDGFHTEQMIRIPNVEDLRRPMVLDTAASETSYFATVNDTNRVVWNRMLSAVDGEGFALVNSVELEHYKD